MPVYKSENSTYYVQCYYRDGRGTRKHEVKRGFETELDALLREKDFRSSHLGTLDMTFRDFVEVYAAEIKPRIREHTWITKEYIIADKIIPFFGGMRMNEIRPIEAVGSELALAVDEVREEDILHLPHHPHDHAGLALPRLLIDFATESGEDAPSMQARSASSSGMSPPLSILLSSL